MLLRKKLCLLLWMVLVLPMAAFAADVPVERKFYIKVVNVKSADSYAFIPGQITVVRGDSVILQFVGEHNEEIIIIIGKPIDEEVSLKPGEIEKIEFVAEKVGRVQLRCEDEDGEELQMYGDIIILPSSLTHGG